MKSLTVPLLQLQVMELFLATFRQNLIVSGSAEAAYLGSVDTHRSRLPSIFQKVGDDLQLSNVTLDQALNTLEQYFQHSENGKIFASLRRILQHSIQDSIKQIQRFQFQIQRQRILLNKRNNIQKAVRFKARILLALTSFLIGFITPVSPLFEILTDLTTNLFTTSLASITLDPSPFAIIFPLSLFILVQVRTSYRVNDPHRSKLLIVSMILYAVGYLIAHNMFNFTLYLS